MNDGHSIGGLLGILAARISESIRNTVTQGLGIAITVLGITMALKSDQIVIVHHEYCGWRYSRGANKDQEANLALSWRYVGQIEQQIDFPSISDNQHLGRLRHLYARLLHRRHGDIRSIGWWAAA